MGVDFMPNDQWLVTSSIAGEFSVFSVKRQERIFYHDSIPELEKVKADNALPAEANYDIVKAPADEYHSDQVSNIMYCVRTVKGVEDEENVFLVGAEDANVTKYKINYNYV